MSFLGHKLLLHKKTISSSSNRIQKPLTDTKKKNIEVVLKTKAPKQNHKRIFLFLNELKKITLFLNLPIATQYL